MTVVVHTMVNFNLMPALLCTFSWISASVSQFCTVEVQPGEEVTLQCSNLSSFPTHIYWFKLTNRSNASCISSMYSSDSSVHRLEGFKNETYNVTSNTSVIFLKITQVDFSDSGLYFCGENNNGKTVMFSATYLKVQVKDGLTYLTKVILCSLTVLLLLVIICLLFQIKRFHTAQDDGQNPPHSEKVDSDDINYAALSFHPKAKISRSAPPRELEPNVVYAATR